MTGVDLRGRAGAAGRRRRAALRLPGPGGGRAHQLLRPRRVGADAPGFKELDDALEIRRRVLLGLRGGGAGDRPGRARRAADLRRRRRRADRRRAGGRHRRRRATSWASDFRRVDRRQARVVLLERPTAILTPFEPALSRAGARPAEELGVEVRTGARVDGDRRARRLRWAASASTPAPCCGAGRRAQPARGGAGRAARPRRAGRSSARLHGPGHPEVFVDRRHGARSRPRRDGRCPASARSRSSRGARVARNILADVAGCRAQPFRYVDKGFMATIGRARAVAQSAGCSMSGPHRLAGLGVRPHLVPGRLPQPARWYSSTGSGRTSSRATARASSHRTPTSAPP